ncbi:MCE family protein [Mycolicibacterium phlei]
MTASKRARIGLAAVLVVVLVAGSVVVMRGIGEGNRTHVVAYFANSNGIYVGDDVRILGVPVGRIDKIEAEPTKVKISFSYDSQYQVPADAKAVILAPSLVTARAIQLTPAYSGGAALTDGAQIPLDRTAVPVEWDDFRVQLERLAQTLQPTGAGGVSTLGAAVNTAADNLRGEGANFRESIIQLSQSLSILGDHSDDLFSTVENVSILVSALSSSTDLLRQLNVNLAEVTGLLADDPDEVAAAVRDVNTAVGQVQDFVADNRETLSTTSQKLSSVTQVLHESIDDIKQTLHLAPHVVQNFLNVYQPAQASTTGALVINNFADPISFVCGAIQAASRLGAEQSAKLCVQYLAPIVKNRQYNFPPLGQNLFVGTQARPNEVTYSEDWMRPDYIPPQLPEPTAPPHDGDAPLPAEALHATNPAAGLEGLMTPPGAGS